MALVKAGQATTGATTATDKEDADAIPEGIPRHAGNGKPKIRLVENTAKFRYYRRASKYADVIESKYLIDQWKLRAVAFGVSHTPALINRGQAVIRFEQKDQPDKHKKIREDLQNIASDAMDAARTGDRALRGTALHTLSELADAGEDLSYLDPPTRAAVDQWRRIMERFTVHGTEQFVVNDGYDLAGSYDRLLSPLGVMRGPDGDVRLTPDDLVIVDLKSGADSKYFGATYCGQQAGYAGGTPYVHVDDATAATGDSGRREWVGGRRPNQQWALIPHIPIENPADAGLMWVNLEQGRADLDLAQANYAARKLDDARFAEAELPELSAAAPVDNTVGLVETLHDLIEHAAEVGAFDALYEQNADVWTPELTEAVRDRIKVLTEGVAA